MYMRKKKLFNFLPDMEMIEVKSEEFKNSSYRLKDSSNHFWGSESFRKSLNWAWKFSRVRVFFSYRILLYFKF